MKDCIRALRCVYVWYVRIICSLILLPGKLLMKSGSDKFPMGDTKQSDSARGPNEVGGLPDYHHICQEREASRAR